VPVPSPPRSPKPVQAHGRPYEGLVAVGRGQAPAEPVPGWRAGDWLQSPDLGGAPVPVPSPPRSPKPVQADGRPCEGLVVVSRGQAPTEPVPGWCAGDWLQSPDLGGAPVPVPSPPCSPKPVQADRRPCGGLVVGEQGTGTCGASPGLVRCDSQSDFARRILESHPGR